MRKNATLSLAHLLNVLFGRDNHKLSCVLFWVMRGGILGNTSMPFLFLFNIFCSNGLKRFLKKTLQSRQDVLTLRL